MNSALIEGILMAVKGQVLVPILVAVLLPLTLAGQQAEQRCSDYLYGLYYGSWDNKGSDLAFVISSNGQAIPPKANDPDAPTHPGFYAGEKHFEFAGTKFSSRELSFRTKTVDGTVFSFHGRVGCESVDVIPEVPYLEGELKEIKNGRLVRKKKLHFGHAVVL